MDLLVCNAAEKEATKAKLIEFMEQNDIAYNLLECCGCDRFCIDLSGEENLRKRYCCNSGIIVQSRSKDVCTIYPHEILYIAIEDRKSVLYLTDRKSKLITALTIGKVFLTSKYLLNRITALLLISIMSMRLQESG